MANTKSAKIANRKAIRRAEINKARRSRIRTFVRKVEEAIASGNYTEAMKAFRKAESEVMRGVTNKVIKLNTASRKISRLNAQVKKLNNKSVAA